MTQDSKEVFISYAWGGDSEEFVSRLDHAFQNKGITIIRDKRDLGYKGLIREFMEQIGCGKCVIAVISDKYLKSPNCMFELVQVAQNGRFHDRIFPIVLADAQIYDPVQRLKYIKHWEDKKKELNEAIREVGAEFLQGVREEIDQYTEIRNTIAELTSILKNMNTLTPDLHSQSDFETLFNVVEYKLTETLETKNELNNQEHLELKDKEISAEDLSSEVGVNYNKLRELLKAGEWQEADRETRNVMLKAAGRLSEGWLSRESIDKFPSVDLRTIDQLWVKYSKGRFGFSVQKEIEANISDDQDGNRFSEKVGWNGQSGKKAYHELSFNLEAPYGHLPNLAGWGLKWWCFYKDGSGASYAWLFFRPDL